MPIDAPLLPWRNDNQFELLIDGPCFMPRILSVLQGAQRSIDICLYLLEDGLCASALLNVLCHQAEHGVRVRLQLDALGSRRLGQTWRERLLAAGVQLRWFNPLRWRRGLNNVQRDHRKLLLIDQSTGFVGGMGATDEFWTPEPWPRQWHEVMVQITGPVLVDWQRLFDEHWDETPGLSWRALRRARRPWWPAAGAGMGRVAFAGYERQGDILHSLLQRLKLAQQQICIATPYFLPTWSVRRQLIKAAKRGVAVRLLLTSAHTDHPPVRYAGQRYYRRLLKAGVQIYEYQPRFLHLKAVWVDDWVSIGSCNFDYWGLLFNLDANLESLDPALVRQVSDMLQADCEQSHDVQLDAWLARSRTDRLKQWLWGLPDRLLVNLLDRRH
ncbi:phospholipase D-like domain-containing protein [Atopomonas sediminilitoris]|uniref:phospholipase D-like domain-containing protein n=1 Tax=Atopomonas sediminilitoris TaxID=2919919 RepID=UPI001FDA8948|nr:phosphatidylserine/phosphatidylglycerophosphate/cardiolipin synthase family protein [Atopomonas sediminilitoris]